MLTRTFCCLLSIVGVSVGALTVDSGSGAAVQSVTAPSWDNLWWDNTWVHRARVYIDNHENCDVLYDFPIPVHVPYRDSMQPNFDDIRFTDLNGNPLQYWIEEFKPSIYAGVWVRVPEIPAALNIYIYYGNPCASSESEAAGYAEICEPFSDDPTRSGGWSVYRHAGEGTLEGCWDPSDEVLYLTHSECHLGSALFTDIDMNRLDDWVLTFDYLAGGGTGAEGFCTMIYKDEAPYADGSPSCGGGLGFTTAEGNPILGYGVEFDAHSDGGDTPLGHVALIVNSTDKHVTSVRDDRVCDGSWHNARLVFLRGKLSVYLDSDFLFDFMFNSPSGDGNQSGLGFCAATGDLTNDHVIDDVLLRKWTNPMPKSMVGDEEGDEGTIVETTFGQVKAQFQ